MGIISQLKIVFRDKPGNFFVRGSVGRREKSPGDIDMIIFDSGEDGINEDSLPQEIDGREIAYVEYNLKDFNQYFTTRLRTGSDAFESIPIKIDNPKVVEIFEKQKSNFIENNLANYVLYCWLEDKVTENYYSILAVSNNRSYYKSYPGSKRSMLRYYWIARCISGGFNIIDFETAVNDCQSQGLLPSNFIVNYYTINDSLNPLNIDDNFFNLVISMIKWRDTELIKIIKKYIAQKIGSEYIKQIFELSEQGTNSIRLSALYGVSKTYTADKQWLVWLGLSAHANTPSSILVSIYKSCRGNAVYKDIVRNLVRNRAFPLEELNLDLYSNDGDIKRFFHERTEANHN